jgi:hypothetical protein
MALVIVIDLIVVMCLVALAATKGFERTLPVFAFFAILLPVAARIDIGDVFMLTATRLAIATLAGLYIVFGNVNPESHRDNKLSLKYVLLLYVGWCVVSTLNSIVFTTSLKTVISFVFEFYLLYYVYSKSVSSVETIHKIFTACIAALVVCCVFGVIERFTHWNVTDLFPVVTHQFMPGEGRLVGGTGGRIRSTFPHSILFANALAIGIPWALYLLGVAKTKAQKVFLWVAIIIMFYNFYKTLSRGPWLALILSLALLFLFSSGSIRKYLVVIGLITAASLIIRPGVLETLENTYFETLDVNSERGSSYEYRYELMRAGRQALARDFGRFLWGYGPESFYYVGLEAEVAGTGKTEKLESCDSAFVEIMVDTGYVGLFLVAALLTTAALFSLRGFSRLPKPANLLCLVFLISIVAYGFMMVSVMNFGWGQQSYMLWIILALSMVYPGLVQPQSSAKDLTVSPWQKTSPLLAEVSQPRA